MEREARRRHKAGHKTKLFDIMRDRDRTQLTSGVWARALDRDDGMAKDLIERAIEALGAGVASACNLLDVQAVIIGGGLGTRLGEEYALRIEKAMLPHLFVDHDPPGRPRRGARRPGRRDRRGAARARGQGGQCRSRKLTTRSIRSIRRSGRAVAIITWCSSG